VAGGIKHYAGEHPETLAVSDETTTLNWRQLNAKVNQLMRHLHNQGISAGDRISVMATNCTDYAVLSLTAHLGGMSLVPINWHFTADEASYLMSNAGVKALFVGPEQEDVGREAATLAGCGMVCVIGEGLNNALAPISDAEPEWEPPFSSPIFYTSGTTGRPKATRLSQTPTSVPIDAAIDNMKIGAGASGMDEQTVHLTQGPLYHAGPLHNATTTLLIGAVLYIMPRFDPEQSLRMIEAYKITHSMMVPIMFVRLDRLPAVVKAKYDVSSLVATPHIAAPMPIDVKHRMIDWWGPVLSDAYGASEIGVVTRISSEEWMQKPGSVGKPIDSFIINIIDDDGQVMPHGETGIIYMTSLTAVDLEYLDDPGKTAAAHLADKQFTLGDMGWLDEDGYMYLADRRVDMINSGGVNIYPAEIEMTLLAHPAVEDVAVFGIPSEEWGQDVKTAIQLRPGFEASDALTNDILSWIREKIAHYKVPKSIDYHEQLPRYSNGKLHRRVLRDKYW